MEPLSMRMIVRSTNRGGSGVGPSSGDPASEDAQHHWRRLIDRSMEPSASIMIAQHTLLSCCGLILAVGTLAALLAQRIRIPDVAIFLISGIAVGPHASRLTLRFRRLTVASEPFGWRKMRRDPGRDAVCVRGASAANNSR
jgi:hypothetical protein